jgi:hypothetical protein
VNVEYVHEGAVAPLLRFFNFTRGELADLVATMATLAAAQKPVVVRIAPGLFATPVNFKLLHVGVADADHGVVPRDHDTLEWLLTRETWSRVTDRARILAADPSGVKWLDDSGSIGVLLSQNGQW